MPTTLAGGSAEGIAIISRCGFCDGDVAAQTYDGVEDLYFAADPGAFTYLRCQACHSLWLQNRPVGDRLLTAYSSYHTHEEPKPLTSHKSLRGLVRSAYIKSRFGRPAGVIDRLIAGSAMAVIPDNFGINRQLRFAPRAPARVLDYGCGSGEYLLSLEPLGYMLYGAEYDP